MQIPVIFVAFAAFGLFIFYNMKKGTIGPSSFQVYLDEEAKANFARKKNIDSSVYVTPDISSLPFKDALDAAQYPRLIARQKDVKEKAGKKMVNFETPPTNKELKLRYGMANLENITTFEDNYRKYIHSLLSWAEALLDYGFENDAALVLEHSISFGSDFRKSYMLLGDIYKKQKNHESLQILCRKAEESCGSSKEYICNYLESLL